MHGAYSLPGGCSASKYISGQIVILITTGSALTSLRMWSVIKKMYESSKSMVLLEGEKFDTFKIEQGVAHGCSLPPILFAVFINDLLKVEQTGLGIQLSSGKTVGGILFADDFVGIGDSKESLQKLLDVVYSYCSKWRL